jgi:alpha-L-rhamnosidase
MYDIVLDRARAAKSETQSPTNWVAQMIQPSADKGVGTQASFVRKTFEIGAASGAERLYISAQGLYRCFINGERVGNDLLTPGWTAYDKRLSFQVYDVARHLRADTNTIDITKCRSCGRSGAW